MAEPPFRIRRQQIYCLAFSIGIFLGKTSGKTLRPSGRATLQGGDTPSFQEKPGRLDMRCNPGVAFTMR